MSEFGDLLRQARDYKGVTLREAERATRISRNYLAALEGEEFSDLPATTYARGIVRNYAQYLGLDPIATLEQYELATGGAGSSAQVVPTSTPIRAQAHWVPNFAIIAFMVVMSAVVFTWMYSAYFQESASMATTTVGVPTVTPVTSSLMALTTPPATVADQGGGEPTTTPAPDASATPSGEPETLQQTEPTADSGDGSSDGSVDSPASDNPDEQVEGETSDEGLTADPIGAGGHAFVVWIVEDVWLSVTLDGEPVYDGVLPAGAERVYYADTAVISSGNAAYVQLWVDGVNYGSLGDTWDAVFSYP
ncbi:MAG TPA: RodZ domain-containing protein [Thermomicrobiales bacterium]|nr:RodZ domain-containing protein [Thermomicrobiales bacterium]